MPRSGRQADDRQGRNTLQLKFECLICTHYQIPFWPKWTASAPTAHQRFHLHTTFTEIFSHPFINILTSWADSSNPLRMTLTNNRQFYQIKYWLHIDSNRSTNSRFHWQLQNNPQMFAKYKWKKIHILTKLTSTQASKNQKQSYSSTVKCERTAWTTHEKQPYSSSWSPRKFSKRLPT
jgi:hypothetical protein